jgi:hypothetical protein
MNDSQDPDGLSEFAPELSDRTPGERTPVRRSDDDWLSVFTTEPRVDAAPNAEDAALDELSQFAPDEHVIASSDDEDDCLDQFAEQPSISVPPPAAVHRADPWAGPWAAAVVAIMISVLLGTRSFHPAWWNAGAIPLSLYVSTPMVEPGIPSQTLRQFDVVAIDVPRLPSADAHLAPAKVDAGPSAAARSTPATRTQPPVERALRQSPPAVLSAERSPRVPNVNLAPLAPIVVPPTTGSERVIETPTIATRPEVTVAPVKASLPADAAVQEYAVRTALRSYEQAYEALDVTAAAEVWPSVDRRALARAFDTLKSQGLKFTSCAITVMGSSAIARCRGTLEIVRKVGNSMPRTAEHEWVFKMRRLGTDWKIDEVAASQAHRQG